MRPVAEPEVFKDPDGNNIGLMSEVPTATTAQRGASILGLSRVARSLIPPAALQERALRGVVLS